jgi:hypothetical protein
MSLSSFFSRFVASIQPLRAALAAPQAARRRRGSEQTHG